MKPIRFIVLFTTAYLFIYAITPFIGSIPDYVPISLFIGGNFLLVYMVIRVLRKGVPSEKTFEEGYWYDDREKIS
ncbi:MAG: hypothetical protein P8100_12605 [bacterium]|jgi:hypothetical protein